LIGGRVAARTLDMTEPSTSPSASKITPELVKHVSKLARLSLPDEKLAKLAGQLEHILEYVNKIQRLDTAGVEPMAHALPLHNVLREDVVGASLSIEQVLQNAPDVEGRFFKVPKVIGGEEDSAG
jgi:aspartyl-tRNA(Asn)/glutamyl-tRNA(Gln) amidotransferase subunit C